LEFATDGNFMQQWPGGPSSSKYKDTSPKVGSSRYPRARAEQQQLTARQQKFIDVKTSCPWPSSAKTARLAGYSESVARKADRIIVRGSRIVSLILKRWMRSQEIEWERRIKQLIQR